MEFLMVDGETIIYGFGWCGMRIHNHHKPATAIVLFYAVRRTVAVSIFLRELLFLFFAVGGRGLLFVFPATPFRHVCASPSNGQLSFMSTLLAIPLHTNTHCDALDLIFVADKDCDCICNVLMRIIQ
jgi:hypothetical protein